MKILKKSSFLKFCAITAMLFYMGFAAFAQNISITGTVLDESNEPLPGVTVMVVGTTTGTATDVLGRYQINVPDADAVLQFSFIGFITVEEIVGVRRVIDIILPESAQAFDDLVVVGYGVQRRSVVTGSISSIRSDDIEKLTPSRIEHVLRGQVAGVAITQNDGQPGSGVRIRVRGTGTTEDSNPLYIIDGMDIDGGIRMLNPSDIASVEILKDAAAAAVYGARGGNGVILITTHRGLAGKPRINYEMSYGFQNPAKLIPMANTLQYMTLQNEMRLNGGEAPMYLAEDLAKARRGELPDTDWVDVAFNKNAPVSNHQISVRGGNDRGTYFLSLGRFDQEGIMGGNFGRSNFERWSIRTNNDYEIFRADDRNFLNKLRVGINASYSKSKSTDINSNDVFGTALHSAMTLAPYMPVYLPEDEGIALLLDQPYALVHDGKVLSVSPSHFNEARHPLSYYLRPDRQFNHEDKFVGSFYGEFDILPGLVFRTNFGFDLAFWGHTGYRFPFFVSYVSQAATDSDPLRSRAWARLERGFTRQLENTLTYNFSFENHSFNLLAGQSMRDNKAMMVNGEALDLKAYDPHLAIINNGLMTRANGGRNAGGSISESAFASYFGRITYDYAERYMIQATVRRDGSFRFGPGNKWGVFPAVSVGWNVWREPYMQAYKPNWFEELKVRGSWGVNGNDRISNWRYLAMQETGGNFYFGEGWASPHYGLNTGRLPNPNIHWEESTQTNFGVDMMFFRNALSFSFDWYTKKTTGMLREAINPGYVGQSANYVNTGEIDNTGIEFDLGYRFSPVRDLRISIRANASYVKNTVINYGNAAGFVMAGGIGAAGVVNFRRTENGMPLPFFYGFKTDGIFQTQEEANEYNEKFRLTGNNAARPGDVRFVNTTGPNPEDGLYYMSDSGDNDQRVMLGKPNPDWVYGLTLTADYKGFDLHAFFQGVHGVEIYDITRRADIPRGNFQAWMLDRWHGPGTSNKYPAIRSAVDDRNWGRASDLYIKSGNYLRLKSIQLGYTLPGNLTNMVSIERMRVWIGGENLLTFTKYDGFDPEIGSSQGASQMGNYPQARVVNFGVGLTF